MNPKRIKNVNIEMVGRTTGPNPCPVCLDADPFYKQKAARKPDKIFYKEIEVDSAEARARKDYNKIKGLPQTRVCTNYTSGRHKCKTITGFDPHDFEYLDQL